MLTRCLMAVITAASVGAAYVGRVDTIGGTTYDWQMVGAQWRTLVCAPAFGLHATWQRSLDSSPNPDRNIAYNYYDFRTRQWGWLDTGYMRSGMNVFLDRTGFGSLAADPQSGVAVISAHHGSISPVVGRDAAPGAGNFEFCEGAPTLEGYQWPCVGVTSQGMVSLAMVNEGSLDSICHSLGRAWCSWSSPRRFTPKLTLINHAIAASRLSGNICLTWANQRAPGSFSRASLMPSTNSGASWLPQVFLTPPDVFGGDTAESWSFSGLFPFYDASDRLHLAGPVVPVVRETSYVAPVAIVHWCAENNPQWSTIVRAAPASLAGGLGYYTVFADRPSLGCGAEGNLYVAWEQADPFNVEPQTGLLRFGVWTASSTDNGRTWRSPRRLTDSCTVSHRFPCITDLTVGDSTGDTVAVAYLMDRCAGFDVQSQGPATQNPVVCQFVPTGYVVGVAGPRPEAVPRRVAGPVLVRSVLSLPGPGNGGQTELVDASGRKVMDLAPGDNDVSRLAPGVYFVRSRSSCGVAGLPGDKVVIAD